MGDRKDNAEQIAELSYEESYRRLQEVLEKLEAADRPLADSLELYESGMELAARCGELLAEAELRVKKWQPDGALVEFGADLDQ